MTKEDFEATYAERSGMTVAYLRELGRMAIPCDCDSSDCRGWQMIHIESFQLDEIAALPESFRSEARELRKAIRQTKEIVDL